MLARFEFDQDAKREFKKKEGRSRLTVFTQESNGFRFSFYTITKFWTLPSFVMAGRRRREKSRQERFSLKCITLFAYCVEEQFTI